MNEGIKNYEKALFNIVSRHEAVFQDCRTEEFETKFIESDKDREVVEKVNRIIRRHKVKE